MKSIQKDAGEMKRTMEQIQETVVEEVQVQVEATPSGTGDMVENGEMESIDLKESVSPTVHVDSVEESVGTMDLTDTMTRTDSTPVPEPLREQFKRTSSLQHYAMATVNTNPPYYIQDAFWSPLMQVEHDDPVVSIAHEYHWNLLATATSTHVYITHLQTNEILFHRAIRDVRYYMDRQDLKESARITHVVFLPLQGDPCFLLCTTQSLFFYELTRNGRVVLSPRMGYHADTDFERVVGYLDTEPYHLLVTPHRVISLRPFDGGMQVMTVRDIQDRVTYGGTTLVQGTLDSLDAQRLVLCTQQGVQLLDIPDLNQTYTTTWADMSLST
jgi:hypothetical protein